MITMCMIMIDSKRIMKFFAKYITVHIVILYAVVEIVTYGCATHAVMYNTQCTVHNAQQRTEHIVNQFYFCAKNKIKLLQ